MPFRSKAQMGFMFAKHPKIAKRWAGEMKAMHQSMTNLPEKKKKKSRTVLTKGGA